MKVVKPLKVPVLTRVIERARRPEFHVATLLGFPLSAPRQLLDELALWQVAMTVLGEAPLDDAITKQCGELLVAGSFFAPAGVAVAASHVRVRLEGIDKRLSVVGDREWRGGVPTEPVPMRTMPIDWAHAFGGANFADNPRGKGSSTVMADGVPVQPLPNVEPFGALVRSPNEIPEPAGFLPIDVSAPRRRARSGTYDQAWLDNFFPGMPPDMDRNFFNVAPKDQWSATAFRGDEAFIIENMHPDQACIEGTLPGLLTRVFATHRVAGVERFVEIPLQLDTVWLMPTAGIGIVIAHGLLAVEEDDAADIVHLVCACEESQQQKPAEHYRQVMLRRLDKDRGAIRALSDSELMPPRESGVAPNIEGLEIGRWVSSEGLLAKNQARGKKRRAAEAAARVEATFGVASEKTLEDDLVELPSMPSIEDLDALAAFMEAQLDRQAQINHDFREKEAQGREQARIERASAPAEVQKAMIDAEVATGGPPTFSAAHHLSEMRGTLDRARAVGAGIPELEALLVDPTYRRDLEDQERGARDLYQSTAHLRENAKRVDAEDAARLRVQLELAIQTGESFRGRDYTGADLSRKTLSGADLSGIFLEGADLSSAMLDDTNLEGAVLARADLRSAELRRAHLSRANLGAARLENAVFDEADLSEAVLMRSVLTGAQLRRATLRGADLMESLLGGADFTEADFGPVVFVKADLRGTQFSRADLQQATFVECQLDRADFSGALLDKVTFVRCMGESVLFRGARMRQATILDASAFPNADFRGADMLKANLRGADVRFAVFDGAEMTGADLSACDASHATFSRAVIRGGMLVRTRLTAASLVEVDLMDSLASKALIDRADFTGANLYRADLSRARGDNDTKFTDADVRHVRFLPKADPPESAK